MSTPGAPPERIDVGTVGKAHGLDGSFYVVGAAPALMTKGAEVAVDGETEPRTIERRAGTDERPLLRLSGCASRNDADALRGRSLSVPVDAVGELGDDEYWAHQLVGSAVSAHEDGRPLGEVVELMALPSCEVLVVRESGRKDDLLVPMVKDAIVEIDPAGRRVVVDATFLALDDA